MRRTVRAKNLRPFTKADPRINRAGRPRDFDAVRDLVQEFLAEPVTKNRTRLRRLFERMEQSTAGRTKLLEYAYGKVPQPITGKDEEPLTLNIVGWEDALQRVYGNRVPASED